ncbi:uncharacterized protein LOC112458175 [Temnothorax curvispinosus]|uniref:Uncharacterized protein LOC112458175 n=1 Tax=Temnothorax curvispinosus TaxID=300111 RepID=A0A6J1Q7N3_9HYME|nr:uncharacterized protein LOC112458175 [Temnothorax curvispinosus]
MFDPLGFLAPLTFTAKGLIQYLWTLKLDWDDEPPEEVRRQWKSELDALSSFQIPLTFPVGDGVRRELHKFCDASERGYGAVTYIRAVTPSEVKVIILCAKAKVAPSRALSLLRLELYAALVLGNLIDYVRQVLLEHLEIDAEYAWSDAKVVLYWTHSSPHKWKTFVRNRVARIQEKVPVTAWGHVASELNPADHCSRGLFPRELVANTTWWEGPEWLLDFEGRAEPVLSGESSPSEEERIVSLAAINLPNPIYALLDRFSSLDKICRIVEYITKIAQNLKGKSVPATLAVDQVEAHRALLIVVRFVQTEVFSEEIDRLRNGKRLPKPFLKLAPFLDLEGIFRVGGRLVHLGLAFEAKHPVLLPNKHRLTDLVVEHVHRARLHPGRRTLQYLLAQRFWILGFHRVIRRVLSRCYKCFRANPHATQPIMATLPAEKVSQVKPFSISGFCGALCDGHATGSGSLLLQGVRLPLHVLRGQGDTPGGGLLTVYGLFPCCVAALRGSTRPLFAPI